MKYWDISEVVTKQRLFNFVNSIRNIGKTYTTQKFLLNQGIKKGKQSIYLQRTDYDRTHFPLSKVFSKVILREFPDREFTISRDCICDSEVGPIVWSVALSQVQKLKRIGFPKADYLLFDEYQIESGTGEYLTGWNEPNLFINLYHTIDREELRLKCFLLGNDISFYNPYHSHPFFGIPSNPDVIKRNGIWMNKLTLFQMASPSDELRREKDDNPFLQALSGTQYGQYADKGVYLDDDYSGIGKVNSTARYVCTLECEGSYFGLYNNWEDMNLVITDTPNMSCKSTYSLTRDGAKNGIPYLKTNFKWLYELLKKYFFNGSILYANMRVKTKVYGPLTGMF